MSQTDSAVRCPQCQTLHRITTFEPDGLGRGKKVCDCGKKLLVARETMGIAPVAPPPKAQVFGPWRDGQRLVITRKSEMPEKCSRCGTPIFSLQETSLSYSPPSRRRRPGLVAALDSVSQTQSIFVKLGRCQKHTPIMSARTLCTITGLLGIPLSIGIVVASVAAKGPMMPLLFVVLTAASWITAAVAALWPADARIVEMHDDRVFLKGFSQEYLKDLPAWKWSAR